MDSHLGFNIKKNIYLFLRFLLLILFFEIINFEIAKAQDVIKYVTAQDIATKPNTTLGDLLITGGTSTSDGIPAIYIGPTSNLVVAPGKKILIKGSLYDWISIHNISLCTVQNPVVIKNYGGQVETKEFGIRGMSFFKLTGKYDSLHKMSDVNYKGHTVGYAWSQGKYGIFVNNKWSNQDNQLLEIRGDVLNGVKVHSTDFEVEFVESENLSFLLCRNNIGSYRPTTRAPIFSCR